MRSSSTAWSNAAFPAEAASFTATYDAQPGQADMNGVVGFSLKAAYGYTGLAAITRFNSNGAIDVRNGSTYAADRSVRYTAGLLYHFRLVINPATKLYSVYVTAPGAAEVIVASNYHFRSEQAGTSTLNNWATHSDVGWESVCNVAINSSGVGVPPAATSSLVANPGTLSFGSQAVGGTSASQNVTVTNSGNTSVAISGIAATGDFKETNNCPTNLLPNAVCTVSVTFSPTVTGARTGSLNFSDNAVGSPQSVSLAGTGAQATASGSCDLYVSPGGSNANPGTLAAPWQTAQHAFDSVQAGQTVCFRAGTYAMTVSSGFNQVLNRSGIANSPITFTNYPGEVAILHGNTRVAGSYAIFRGSPVTAPGLIFEGPTGIRAGLIEVMNTHDVIFDHVEIRKADYHAGLYQYNGYNIKVLGAYIHDNGVAGNNLDHGIYWDSTTGGGNLIANCVIEHNAAQGIALYSSSSSAQPSQVVIEENTVINNGHYGVAVYGSGHVIVNNILAGNGTVFNSQQLGIETGTNHRIDSNILWSSNTSLQGIYNPTGQAVTRALIVDPLFVNVAQHNYHLTIGSPAIGAGNLGYVQPVDKDNVSRGAGPDLGAYEYVP